MVKRKLEKKYIENEAKRNQVFRNDVMSIFNKVDRAKVLCGCEVYVEICFEGTRYIIDTKNSAEPVKMESVDFWVSKEILERSPGGTGSFSHDASNIRKIVPKKQERNKKKTKYSDPAILFEILGESQQIDIGNVLDIGDARFSFEPLLKPVDLDN